MSVWKIKKYFIGAEICTVVVFFAVCILMARVPAQHVDPVVSMSVEESDEDDGASEDQPILSSSDFTSRLTAEVPIKKPEKQDGVDVKQKFSKADIRQKQIEGRFTLKGTTTVQGDPKKSCAVIQGKETSENLYFPGDVIDEMGGVTLVSVSYDKVAIKHNDTGRRYTIDLQEHKPDAKSTARHPRHHSSSFGSRQNTRRPGRNSTAHSGLSGRDIRKIRPNKYTVSAQTIDPYRKQPGKLFTEISVKPQTTDGTATGGFIITGMKSNALLQKVGLRRGDVVLRVNGKSPMNLMEIVKNPSLSDVTVDYQRGGRNQRLHFSIQK